MRIGRFLRDGEPKWGFVSGDDVTVVEDILSPAGPAITDSIPLVGVQWLAPALPTKIVAVGLNYSNHAAELGMEIPAEPLIFLKPPSAVIGPGAPIVIPRRSVQVDYEAELAVVIGSCAKDVSEGDAAGVILGYTCGNDVTARDLQKLDGQWNRAKGFDTFCPLGPWIETELDPSRLAIETRVNGEVRQSSSTEMMIFDVGRLVAFISSVMTLQAGDVILTGTPPGVGTVKSGDVVTVSIEKIGELSNPVV